MHGTIPFLPKSKMSRSNTAVIAFFVIAFGAMGTIMVLGRPKHTHAAAAAAAPATDNAPRVTRSVTQAGQTRLGAGPEGGAPGRSMSMGAAGPGGTANFMRMRLRE